MSETFSGVCIGGPYSGQKCIYGAKLFEVIMMDGNPVTQSMIRILSGTYEWGRNGSDGVWFWHGPAFANAAHITSGQRTDPERNDDQQDLLSTKP